MKTKVNKIDIMNKLLHDNLVQILKNLNKRIHIKLYALVYDNKQTLVETIRIKKAVPNGENSASASQDALQTIMNVYAEIKIDSKHAGKTYDDIKKYVNQIWYKQHHQNDATNGEKLTMSLPDIEGRQILNLENHINDNRMLYVNQIPFYTGKSTYSVVYILEMRNIEHETRQLFYKKPEISFLRMLLDYFFRDFFAITNSAVKINNDDSISRKYNEDGIQFNRRITRLFFGKIQNYLQNHTKFDEFGVEFDHKQRNEYYVNSLLEKMDDISALTYENASPFGSILFMNKDVITQPSIIRFTVKFTKEDRIGLEDAKRIRKLLELTNVDKDLYLIADEKEVYGLGEVNWNMQKGELALRLDFTGLSKYNLVLVQTETELVSGGKLFVEDEKKVYRSDLNLIEMKLVSVSFKNPRLGEEGYSSEKLIQLLKNTFWQNHTNDDQIKHKVERLDQVVRKAREQKHGTMVVITEALTAKHELHQLSKQSTLIEPGIINPEYIKYLTAIDGAIYFDTDGLCHAIGVILDGIAKEDIGDASRGARYNSAYRYLYKLKEDEQKKCVIVIISEDGMVDLIPESEHEDMLLALVEEIIDMINEEAPDSNKLKEKEDLLLQSKIVDFDWLFNIAEVYSDNENYERAIQFFEYGIKQADKSYILPRYYNLLGNCYHYKGDYKKAIQVYELAIKASDNDKRTHVYMGNTGSSYFSLALQLKDAKEKFENKFNKAIEWLSQAIELSTTLSFKPSVRNYNYRGRCYTELSDIEKNPNKKNQLLKYAIEDYSQAITIDPKNKIYYWNRYCVYNRLSQEKECIEDLIQAEYLEHKDSYISELSSLLEKKHPDFITESVEFYNNLSRQKEGPPQLVELIAEYQAKVEISKQAEAAAGKAPDLDESEK
ncbi:tetratricopeptide repeat protein [Paenibacillus kribbensis]|uniref:tetratricopeptide repeat protein n=1 Tax=Paenibacillus kribbensis TaxID=172713 RepID=UPI002DB778BC|nr:tetratricopeptide repeat protein [Paenibacillus kribbensis]MEC0235704.1 tetratricopeptide repeat protein [Paenibacillus kribbensis]